MNHLSVNDAEKKLYHLIEEMTESHEPVLITGGKNSAVLIPEEDWFSIQETLSLLSIPGMRDSIQEGIATSEEACIKEKDLAW
ncbi:type II toxin-antitoxin system Phd/YefM family antitoxin [Magnetococcales bacterium HHB-1]